MAKKEKLRDRDIRVALLKRNKEFFRSNIYANEYGINSTNVVDVASFDFKNKIFYGFEIKSPRDNLSRLFKQLSSYVTFFNIVYLVAHEKFTEEALEMINNNRHLSRVGLVEVSDDLEFREVKQAQMNKPFFDLFIKNIELEDLRYICENKGINPDGSKRQLVSALKMKVTMDEVYEGIYRKLEKHHIKKCPNCGSNLWYNKRANGEETRTYCFECEHEIPQVF